jgi:hypothetical protein
VRDYAQLARVWNYAAAGIALKALSFFARGARRNLFSMKALSCVFLR